jgi:predicted Fe-S protein YdhL (DUF1289 family)
MCAETPRADDEADAALADAIVEAVRGRRDRKGRCRGCWRRRRTVYDWLERGREQHGHLLTRVETLTVLDAEERALATPTVVILPALEAFAIMVANDRGLAREVRLIRRGCERVSQCVASS